MIKSIFKYILIIPAITFVFWILLNSVYLGNDKIVGEVLRIVHVNESVESEMEMIEERLEVKLSDGKVIEVDNKGFSANVVLHKVGDKLLFQIGEEGYYILDFYRINGVLSLAFLFAIVSVIIAGKGGLLSLISMSLSFLIIFQYILPQILNGKDPVTTVISASIVIIPLTFYLSHGFNIKTTLSIIGTILALLLTSFIAQHFIGVINLNGLESEEAFFLSISEYDNINMRGLLLSGIIVSLLGVLDDVTVSQVNTVLQLHHVNKDLSVSELFKRGLSVGRDHISSTVNTLVLVYTGSSLPLLLIFLGAKANAWELINQEFIATEIVKTLVASVGLVLAIPIVTTLAVYWCKKTKGGSNIKESDLGHHTH